MTGVEFKIMRLRAGLTQKACAALLSCHLVTIQKIEGGQRQAGHALAELLSMKVEQKKEGEKK